MAVASLPWMMITNAVLFAALLMVTVVPPLFIYNPERSPGVSPGPPTAGGVLPDEATNPSVKQRLYILFVLPACAFLNSLFLYFSFYRHLRHIQFRVELSSVANANLVVAAAAVVPADMQAPLSREASFAEGGSEVKHARTSFTALMDRKPADRSAVRRRRHSRPEGLSMYYYATSPLFPELRELQKVVEERFLETADATRCDALSTLDKNILCYVEEQRNLQPQSLYRSITHLLVHHTTVLSDIEAKLYLSTIPAELTNRPPN